MIFSLGKLNREKHWSLELGKAVYFHVCTEIVTNVFDFSLSFSYIALECAGFLNAFGYDTSVMVRSIFLRGFDQQMADMVAAAAAEKGVKFIQKVSEMTELFEWNNIEIGELMLDLCFIFFE